MNRIVPRVAFLGCAVACIALLYGCYRPVTVRIIYTGDTLGYLEPCGCGDEERGGLARRATALARLAGETPNCLIVDSGSLSSDPERAKLIASAMGRMGYQAIGIGRTDLACWRQFSRSVAAANIKVVDSLRGPRDGTVPCVIRSLGTLNFSGVAIRRARVAVVSFGGYALDLGVRPRPVDERSYERARRDSEVLVVLDQAGLATAKWIRRQAARGLAPDVVIGSGEPGVSAPRQVGRTLVAPTALRAPFVGYVDVRTTPILGRSIRSGRVELDEDVVANAAVARDVANAAHELLDKQMAAAASAPAVPPERCKECHPREYAQWTTTAHAHAENTLIAKGKLRPECLLCHSEGYKLEQRAAFGSNGLGGVGCVSCHRDPHATVDARSGCRTCHSEDRSPRFSMASYLPRVLHAAPGQAKRSASVNRAADSR